MYKNMGQSVAGAPMKPMAKPPMPAMPPQGAQPPNWNSGSKDNDDQMQKPIPGIPAPTSQAAPPISGAGMAPPPASMPSATPINMNTGINPSGGQSPLLSLLMQRAMGTQPQPPVVTGNVPQPSAMPGQPVGV